MSQFLHHHDDDNNNDAKAIAIPQVFAENSEAKKHIYYNHKHSYSFATNRNSPTSSKKLIFL